MQARLQANVAASGLANVSCVTGGFVSYEHAGPPADVVYSRLALHHIPDFWKAQALVRIAGRLRPGGILRLWDVVYGFEPHEAAEVIEAWCATAGTGVETGWLRAEYEEHVRDEHSTFTWLLEPMIERAGFTIELAEPSEDRMFAAYVARRR